MGVVFTLLAGLVLLGPLVFFHELGHFLAAKFFGVKVLKFSLGFGPRVWGFTRGETEYQIAALPIGGFVRMAGEDPTQEVLEEDRGRGFLEQAPWKRAIISFAGPGVNLLLPPIVFFFMFLSPQQAPPAYVGAVLPDEPADRAGLQPGDRVVGLDGIAVRTFDEMRELIEARPGKASTIAVERAGQRLELPITPSVEVETNLIESVTKGKIGIVAGRMAPFVGVVPGSRADQAGLHTFDRLDSVNGTPTRTTVDLERALATAGAGPLTFSVVRGVEDERTAPKEPPKPITITVPAGEGPLGFDPPDLYVREVTPDSSAAAAGLKPLDRLVSFDGVPVKSGLRLQKLIDNHFQSRQPALKVGVQRGAEVVELPIEAKLVEKMHKLYGPYEVLDTGFTFAASVLTPVPFAPEELATVTLSVPEALRRGFVQSFTVARQMVLSLTKISPRQVGGPIQMFQLAGAYAEHGFMDFMNIFALISINLGIVNLLPIIPVLDGFHIAVAAVEGISRRRVSLKFREYAQMTGLVMLLLLFALAFFNDLWRTFTAS